MSEIDHLNNIGYAMPSITPATTPASPSGQRFQQLLAQSPPAGAADQNWDKAAEFLQNTEYVQNGQLTATGQNKITQAQSQMQNQHEVEISLELASVQVLIDSMTTRLATEDNPALMQQAQQLQTKLQAKINALKSPATEAPPPEDALNIQALENQLQTLLDALGINRDTLEATTIDTGNGPIAAKVLVAGQSEEQTLGTLIVVAQQLEAAPSKATAPDPETAPKEPPVVQAVNVTLPEKMIPGDLYKFEVGNGSREDTLELIMDSFLQYRNQTYVGSTYHLQFLDADGKVIPIAPSIDMSSSGMPESTHALNTRLQGLSRLFSGTTDQISVYWHGFKNSSGTNYMVGGYSTESEQGSIKKFPEVDMPIFIIEQNGVKQRVSMDQIPFASVLVSNESNQLYNLPTQADIDAAKTALQRPQELTLQQLLQYTHRGLQRSSISMSYDIANAVTQENVETIIGNAFTDQQTIADTLKTAELLSSFVISNRRGLNQIQNVESIILPAIQQHKIQHMHAIKLSAVKNLLAERAPGRDFSDISLDTHGDINLTGIDLSGLDLSNVVFYRTTLDQANLNNANLEDTLFINSSLRLASMQSANLQGISLRRTSMVGAKLHSADLSNANLEGISLASAKLSNANLNGTNLGLANLSHADMSGTYLAGANLASSNLSETNLQRANLSNANLEFATIYKTNLTGAELSGADFNSTELLVTVIVDDATINSHPYLKQQLTPQFDIEAFVNSAQISQISSFSELQVLHDDIVKLRNNQALDIDKQRINTKLLPLIKDRAEELLLSGTPTHDMTFAGIDLSHQDLTSLQLAGAKFEQTDFSYSNMQGMNLEKISMGSYNTYLDGANLRQANLAGSRLINFNANGAQLQGVNLRNSTLIKLTLEDADLSGANVSGAVLKQIDLSETNISRLSFNSKTQWSYVTFTAAQAQTLGLQPQTPGFSYDTLDSQALITFSGLGVTPDVEKIIHTPGLTKASEELSNLANPEQTSSPMRWHGQYDFEALDLSNLNLSNTGLQKSNFHKTTLRNVDFNGAYLNMANFEQADLHGANLSKTKIRHANFQTANLTSASLIDTNARGANFGAAQLVDSDLTQANLGGANLVNANLQGANLSNADLRSVNASGANLTAANLGGVDLRQTDLSNIRYDQTTQWHGAQLTGPQIQSLGLNTAQLATHDTSGESSSPFANQPGPVIPPPTVDNPSTQNDGPQLNSQHNPDSSGFSFSNILKPFNIPNGVVGTNGSQAGHQPPNNNGGTITAVAGDAPEPDQPFQIINGQVSISGVLLPELDLSQGMAQSGDRIFGTPVGLPALPEYTPSPRTEPANDIPIADISPQSPRLSARQEGGITIGGKLGNDKGKTAAELGLDPQGLMKGPSKAKVPELPGGFGEGVNTQDLNQQNTRDWGDGPAGPDLAKRPPEGFPEQDKVLQDILNPEGPSGARFKFPPGNEEIPAAEYQAAIKTLPALQQISVAQYNQLSSADQKNIISRAVEYQSLPADIQATTTLLEYADSTQTSATQRRQMLGEQQRQTVKTTQKTLSSAQSGLSNSALQLIDARIEVLQANTATLKQQTQALTQNNASRQSALATPTTTDSATAAFIKPDIKPGQTPPASNSTSAPQVNSQTSPIPRFMVINTAKGPQLMENLSNGTTQMLPYPIPADTPITRQGSDGGWRNVPDAYAIGAKNLLDTLLLQSTVKMLNGGNAVQAPGAQNATPQAPTNLPQPAF